MQRHADEDRPGHDENANEIVGAEFGAHAKHDDLNERNDEEFEIVAEIVTEKGGLQHAENHGDADTGWKD